VDLGWKDFDSEPFVKHDQKDLKDIQKPHGSYLNTRNRSDCRSYGTR